ncbi:MAG: dependent oxidoreductase [Chloroflexi bacterium]|nr:dependent oxidoreductase [Chloroflexota bacterium]
MTQSIETIIIGGGQAGLATSYFLTQASREHLVLEQAVQAANAWRNDRWDSFSLLTPNWSFRLPGAEYDGPARDSFMPRHEIISRFEGYIARYRLPVQYNMQVSSVEPCPNGDGYRVRTHETELEARNVVVATGMFQKPKIPAFAGSLPARIEQLHSGHYRNPAALSPGAVLVVGSAQSGCQIAEELYLSGRKVYLCTGSAGRAPRRYRGKDVFEWQHLSGFLDRTVDQLPSSRMKFAANPHLSGRDGGRTLNLHQFARDGVTLLGKLQDGSGNKLWMASDLKENLAKADQFEANLVKMIDAYIARAGLDAPEESLPVLRDGFDAEIITELDLHKAGITSIIWAMGYRFDFSLVKLPVFDGDGYPVQQRGVTDYPGLYFVGLPWLSAVVV